MSGLPTGWINTILDDISTIITGKTPSKKNPEYFNGSIPFIKPGDVVNQGVIESTSERLSEKGADSVPVIPKGAITVTCIGNLGRVAITKEKSATNQQINSCVPHDGIFSKYLYYYLLTIKPWMETESSSTTVAIINKSRFSRAPIKLAPLNEQIHIANKLDSMLAKVDAAQARLDKIPSILKRFRQSVLAAATSGELTKEWRGEHNEKLTYKLLGDTGVSIKTGPFGSALHKSDYVNNGIAVINPMHINDGIITPRDSMSITLDKFNELQAWHLRVGDIILGRRGEMGRAAEVKDIKGMLCGTGSMILRVNNSGLLPSYLCLILRSQNAVNYFMSNSVGSTMVNLNQKVIKGLSIHFPSFEEQSEIFRRVESLFTMADTIGKQYQAIRKNTDRLTQSLLAKAFRGELVPQDENDEPAEQLLAKIKAAMPLKPGAKKGVKR